MAERNWIDYLAHRTDHPAFQCVRPMLFENDTPGYEYSVRGTCFIVTLESRIFVLTSKHGMESWNPDQVCVSLEVGGRDFMPICQYNSPTLRPSRYEGASDFVVWESPRTEYSPQQIEKLSAFDCTTNVTAPSQLHLGFLSFRGFPRCAQNTVDYDTNHITTQPFASPAVFSHPDDENSGLYWLDFDNSDVPVNDLDGMSGSPIFQFSMDQEDRVVAKWAGMMINGSIQSGKAQFIGAHIIRHVLANMALPS